MVVYRCEVTGYTRSYCDWCHSRTNRLYLCGGDGSRIGGNSHRQGGCGRELCEGCWWRPHGYTPELCYDKPHSLRGPPTIKTSPVRKTPREDH